MESFLTQNYFLKQTKASEAYYASEVQQEVNQFLALIEEEYRDDPEYKRIIATAKTTYEPSPLDSLEDSQPGWVARTFHWLRGFELRSLEDSFNNAKQLVPSDLTTVNG